ncbi:MAPEG family protein [Tahibacter aquaticus]|uniref:MAPEG family protein n=1 Tax=Tahibacter aquaticus TaxID=520092 RepID=A0A4R6YVA0_9GAMM|nr:MAPEG family protein [Tahibacter aquaticus]TDR42601.1 MAPEG family protein [Tahibacter aquaticus]
MSSHLPALVVVLTVLLLVLATWMVGRARGRYGIKAPATSGNENFERVFRMQMNTVESTVAFLPCLWLATQYWSPLFAGIGGLVWVAGRVWYAFAYAQAANKRGMGFMIASAAAGVLLVGGGVGVIRALVGI